jgi:hypothetical protein
MTGGAPCRARATTLRQVVEAGGERCHRVAWLTSSEATFSVGIGSAMMPMKSPPACRRPRRPLGGVGGNEVSPGGVAVDVAQRVCHHPVEARHGGHVDQFEHRGDHDGGEDGATDLGTGAWSSFRSELSGGCPGTVRTALWAAGHDRKNR